MPDVSSKLAVTNRLELPWLTPYDREMEKVGYAGVHAVPRLEPGTRVFVDLAIQKAVAVAPDGKVTSWYRNGRMRYDPDDRSWDMEWLELGSQSNPRVTFTPMDEDCDDEIVQESGYQLETNDLEGKQDSYFPLMVELLRDPLYNPAGFPLKSGTYKAEMAEIRIRLNFGEDGSRPSLIPVEESLPAPLDFPYRTEIEVARGIAAANGEIVPPGYYRTRVTSFNTRTGEARSIEVRHQSQKFKINGESIVRAIHDGDIKMLNVLQEHWPNF